jgi:pantothenate kinase type III
MILCVDIGNTNIKLGLYEGSSLMAHWRIFTNPKKLADDYAVLLLSLFGCENINREKITGCAISSVVPELTVAFHDLVKRHLDLEAVIVGQVKKPVIKINTDNPAEVGPDLIANAVGAISLYGAPVIVIGFGTATTFSAISKDKEFEGVSIAPVSAQARPHFSTPGPCCRKWTFTNQSTPSARTPSFLYNPGSSLLCRPCGGHRVAHEKGTGWRCKGGRHRGAGQPDFRGSQLY